MIEYEKEEENVEQELLELKMAMKKHLKPGDKIYLKGKEKVFAKIMFVEEMEEQETGVARKYYLKITDIEEYVVVTDLDIYSHVLWGEWWIESEKIK